ncbi:MAG: hypothetical protein GX593_02585 [Actinomycetales bacterium]|nr:hypothetical protein [Actinomycetales bacterium]
MRATADPAQPGWTARLDGVLTFAVARDAQYGAYTAAILQGDRALGKVLGRRLIARHPDEASVRELLDLVDTWLRWRLVTVPGAQHGASPLARQLLSDPLMQLVLEPSDLLVPWADRPSRPERHLSINGDPAVDVAEAEGGAWQIICNQRGHRTLALVTNDECALLLGVVGAMGRLSASHARFLRSFVYDEPRTVRIAEHEDGTFRLTWGEDRWLVHHGRFTESIQLAHLLEADPEDLLESARSPEGLPLFRGSEEHFAEVAARGSPRENPTFRTGAEWRVWLAGAPGAMIAATAAPMEGR